MSSWRKVLIPVAAAMIFVGMLAWSSQKDAATNSEVEGPARVARDYLSALWSKDFMKAYGLTSPSFQEKVSFDDFRRYHDAISDIPEVTGTPEVRSSTNRTEVRFNTTLKKKSNQLSVTVVNTPKGFLVEPNHRPYWAKSGRTDKPFLEATMNGVRMRVLPFTRFQTDEPATVKQGNFWVEVQNTSNKTVRWNSPTSNLSLSNGNGKVFGPAILVMSRDIQRQIENDVEYVDFKPGENGAFKFEIGWFEFEELQIVNLHLGEFTNGTETWKYSFEGVPGAISEYAE